MNLVFKVLVFYYSFVSFFERKIFIKNIKNDDLVLDIGSGDKPFWRADVIADKYLEDDQQRYSGSMIYDRRKIFVEADVESLPFKDKAFDFVFCTHLLEHVENPDKAIKEIIRVGKKGYIEVPNGIVDLLEPFPPHLWFCNYKDGILTFIQKEKVKNPLIGITELFGSDFFKKSIFRYIIIKFHSKTFIELYWDNSIKYEVIRSKNPYKYIYKKDVGQKKGMIEKTSMIIYKIIYYLTTIIMYRKKNLKLEDLKKLI